MVKRGTVLLATVLFAVVALSSRGFAARLSYPLASASYYEVGDVLRLPPSFRNHCSYDESRGRYFCSNHCGWNYQVYYCSGASFGCCHVGAGYCGWDGLLRCQP